MRHCLFLNMAWFFQNLRKDWRVEASHWFVLFLFQQKSDRKPSGFYKLWKDCDLEDVKIPQLNISYQISTTQDSNIYFLLIKMSSNHDLMFY